MIRYFKNLWNELGKSIFEGSRLQSNLRVLTCVSVVTAVLGLVLIVMDIVRGEDLVLLLAACATFLGGAGCAYFAHFRKNRRAAVAIPTAFCIVAFTLYAFTGMGQGTAIYWSLLMPIGISYFVGVRADSSTRRTWRPFSALSTTARWTKPPAAPTKCSPRRWSSG